MLNISLFPKTDEQDDILSVYKQLLSSEFGIWIWEADTDVLYFNEAYMRMLGYEHCQYPFHISTWIKLIHPDDRSPTVEVQQEMLSTLSLGNSFEHRFRMLNASGEYQWILGRGFIICRDQNGKATRVSGMHLDLRTLDQTLEDTAIEHDRVRFALEAAQDGLWDWNTSTGEVYFSPRYISMLGYTQQEFPATVESWAERVHPDDLESTVQMQYNHIKNDALADLFECVYRFLAADGTYKWILGRGKVTRRDANGRGTRLVGLHTDITELRNTQERLTTLLHQDSLTQLYSRFYFDTAMEELSPEDYPVSVLFCDVNGLKLVNDNAGHPMGDQLLIGTANILRQSLPASSIIGRLGGDEFAVLLPRTRRSTAAIHMARITEACVRHNTNPAALPIFLAIGAVSAEQNGIPGHKLLAQADTDMRLNKSLTHSLNLSVIRQWLEHYTGQPVSLVDRRLQGSSSIS